MHKIAQGPSKIGLKDLLSTFPPCPGCPNLRFFTSTQNVTWFFECQIVARRLSEFGCLSLKMKTVTRWCSNFSLLNFPPWTFWSTKVACCSTLRTHHHLSQNMQAKIKLSNSPILGIVFKWLHTCFTSNKFINPLCNIILGNNVKQSYTLHINHIKYSSLWNEDHYH